MILIKLLNSFDFGIFVREAYPTYKLNFLKSL